MKKYKYLLFTLFILITEGSFIEIKAQATVNIEQVTKNLKTKASLKFIEGLDLSQEKSFEVVEVRSDLKSADINLNVITVNPNFYGIEKCSPLQFKYAMLINMEVEDVTNTLLYNFIEEWWATRYHYGGTDKSGIDCSAFSSKVLLNIYGIVLPRTSSEQYAVSEKISRQNLKEGDLVFFNTRGGVSHVGVYLGNNFFVHSSVKSGVTINSLTDDYYNRKFIGGGRIAKN